MDFQITVGERGDRATRIYQQIREAILDGRLRADEQLPPSRELAARLLVSRNTVALAYERLTAEGFLTSKVGAGTFVSNTPRTRGRTAPAGTGVRPRAQWADAEIFAQPGPVEPRFNFGVGMPDPKLFPWDTWRRLVSQVLRPTTLCASGYDEPAGHAGLRAAIARYIGVSRSVRAAAADVLITRGAQQALDLIGRVLIDPGDVVAVEEPGYPPARALFASLGAKVLGVPVDEEGIVVRSIPRTARLVYTTPSHQFPLGTAMSLPRRAALLTWAELHDAVVIEDDYDSEFRFADRPLEPLQSLDRTGRVIYVGSFAKTLLPMLRIGFLVAPESLRTALHAAKQLTDWHNELVGQVALARFIDEGLLARHVRKATREYAQRRAAITGILTQDFADWFDIVPSSAGLHLCAPVRPHASIDVASVAAQARQAGIAVDELARYGGGPGLVFGYGGISRVDIPTGLARLAGIIQGFQFWRS
ncbi:MAG TPA: PLP-dependent aminotransferase family protein [Pseudonocardiaceae bacterium]|nr:PLP-dependent aminotransferase family protein [Pseudonocardiaceae bacterium]